MSNRIFYLITGMAGAGKSSVLDFLEDRGFYCVDNLPPGLFDKFFELLAESVDSRPQVALASDLRSGSQFAKVTSSLKILSIHKIPFRVIFLDCSDEVLLNRFQETRRRHPLYKGNLLEAIQKERKLLQPLLENADFVIDTTHLKARSLGQKLQNLVSQLEDSTAHKLHLTLSSFGFKNGIPADCDMILDVRFMENPFYVEELRARSGQDKSVRDFVFASESSKIFLEKVEGLVRFLLPCYIAEGRNQFHLSFGCTGGQHRSVACVEVLCESISQMSEVLVSKYHRDCDK